MAKDGREAVVDDVEESTEVNRLEREASAPCAPCRRSGSITIARHDGRSEMRVCPMCRGMGFRRVRFRGDRALEAGGVR
jgi:hypothetical protein